MRHTQIIIRNFIHNFVILLVLRFFFIYITLQFCSIVFGIYFQYQITFTYFTFFLNYILKMKNVSGSILKKLYLRNCMLKHFTEQTEFSLYGNEEQEIITQSIFLNKMPRSKLKMHTLYYSPQHIIQQTLLLCLFRLHLLPFGAFYGVYLFCIKNIST